ncbi:uncharacterized protein DFL_007173 [Arthrobotrys flagrans]|uniref:Uncharacterized protein n=1 Tax=Arthrobotrys flagrans TaxID=97331 RepID=A0A436ZUY4_ARTFL|nr:hypothetical protein DFL_007173 [Arthrobotrys flagrans]
MQGGLVLHSLSARFVRCVGLDKVLAGCVAERVVLRAVWCLVYSRPSSAFSLQLSTPNHHHIITITVTFTNFTTNSHLSTAVRARSLSVPLIYHSSGTLPRLLSHLALSLSDPAACSQRPSLFSPEPRICNSR